MVVILRSCPGPSSLDFKMSMKFLPDSAGECEVQVDFETDRNAENSTEFYNPHLIREKLLRYSCKKKKTKLHSVLPPMKPWYNTVSNHH